MQGLRNPSFLECVAARFQRVASSLSTPFPCKYRPSPANYPPEASGEGGKSQESAQPVASLDSSGRAVGNIVSDLERHPEPARSRLVKQEAARIHTTPKGEGGL